MSGPVAAGVARDRCPVRVLAALALLCAAARAETATDEGGEGGEAKRLPTVAVVGSRLDRTERDGSQPVLVLTRADIERTGLTAVADILQQLSISGLALGRGINQAYTSGETRVNLRGLGENRTLVLLNGRRWAPGLDGAADLSQIPLVMIDRIEVLADGASAIYGSDAIAGVVNLVTRDRYDGAEAGAYLGGWEQGDGQAEVLDFSLGHDGERGGAALSLSWERNDAVFARDRALSSAPVPPGTSPNDSRLNNLAPQIGGLFATPTTEYGSYLVPGFLVGGNAVPLTLIAGRSGTSPDDFRPFDPSIDGYSPSSVQYLVTPQERRSLYAQGYYPIGDEVTFEAELLLNRRDSDQLLGPARPAIQPSLAGPAGQVRIDANNLYNPFDRTISVFQRRLVELGGRRYEQQVDTARAVAGFDGRFAWAGRDWHWDAHASFSRSELDATQAGVIDWVRFGEALGPSFLDAQGVAQCGTPQAAIAGCVPLNLFGGPDSITPEMASYIEVTTRSNIATEQTDFTANLRTDLIDLPAGPLALATGYEHRREQGEDEPDPLLLANRVGGAVANRQPTQGSYSVDEVYLEGNAPLLRDQPFARALDVDLAVRWSDYSSFGDTTNGRAGVRWQPLPELLARASWGRGFRAPSIAELFLGTATAINQQLAVPDPCAPDAHPDAAVRARCAADGVPEAYLPAAVTTVTRGGNPDLEPERSIQRSAGLVYSPAGWPGLDLSLDWYRIEIDLAIGARTPAAVVMQCYVGGEPLACDRVTRNAQGQLFLVDATNQNLPGGLETEGYDFAVDWRFTGADSDWRVRWDIAYVDYFGDRGRPARLTRLPDGTLLQGNRVATVEGAAASSLSRLPATYWRIRSTAQLTWQRDAWSATLGLRYFSELEENCRFAALYAANTGQPEYRENCDDPDRVVDLDGDGIGEPAAVHTVGDAWFADVQAAWDAPWDARIAVGVRNAFDRDPPTSFDSINGFVSAYDIPGRFWYLSYRQQF